MILLDTNVISETMRPHPAPVVVAWLDARPPLDLWLAAPVLAELSYGIERLPVSRRREALQEALREMEAGLFAGRVLPFDAEAARCYGAIVATREQAGRPIAVMDAMIAAITRAHGARLATRNLADFEGLGLDCVDPFAP